jgi:hypothetical protein
MRKSNSQRHAVETPAGTFERACFDDRLEEYLPDSFYMKQSMKQPASPMPGKRTAPRRVTPRRVRPRVPAS